LGLRDISDEAFATLMGEPSPGTPKAARGRYRQPYVMYFEGSSDRIGVGDVIPAEQLQNLNGGQSDAINGVEYDDIGWYESVWGFADANGKKVGSMRMAMEDHRGFLGSNVYMGYNPWGWGGQNQLRGIAFNPESLISPEMMESIASDTLPGIQVIDPDGDKMNLLENYLPFNRAVNNFNELTPLLEDEEASVSEYIDALVGNGIGVIENGDYEFEINRFTTQEKVALIAKLKEALNEKQLSYLGLDKLGPGDVKTNILFDNIINSLPEVDYALLKNEINGNTRFSLPISDFEKAFESWIANDARSSWFDREYLEYIEGDKAFMAEVSADPSARHDDGSSYVENDSNWGPAWYQNGFDSASFLDMVFESITGNKKYNEYESLRAAIMKTGQTPIKWDANETKRIPKSLWSQSNLDTLQPTFRNDRFGLTNMSKKYDRRSQVKPYHMRVKVNPNGIRFRNYDQGGGVIRRYVANPLKKIKNKNTAWMQADLLRRNGLYVRSVKMSDGSYLNYTSSKSQRPSYSNRALALRRNK
jgi:hypothetical protein